MLGTNNEEHEIAHNRRNSKGGACPSLFRALKTRQVFGGLGGSSGRDATHALGGAHAVCSMMDTLECPSQSSHVNEPLESGIDAMDEDVKYRGISSVPYARRMTVARRMMGHSGCVNCVTWSERGEWILSGSDDCAFNLWDGDSGDLVATIASGHRANIFDAKFMSSSGCTKIASCAADGIVRFTDINTLPKYTPGSSATRIVNSGVVFDGHDGMTYMVQPDPDSPHVFYSCSDDGTIYMHDVRAHAPSGQANIHGPEPDRQHSVLLRYGPVESDPQKLDPTAGFSGPARRRMRTILGLGAAAGITCFAIRPDLPNILVTGSNDDIVALWDKRQTTRPFYKWRPSFATCTARTDVPHKITDIRWDPNPSTAGSLLVSFSEADVVLIRPNMSDCSDGSMNEIAGESHVEQIFRGHINEKTMIKEANFFGPDVIVCGSDDGRVYLWDRHTANLLAAPQNVDSRIVNCVQPHPTLPIILASGIDDDIKVLEPSNLPLIPQGGVNVAEIQHNSLSKNDHSDQIPAPAADVPHNIRRALCRNLNARPKYARKWASMMNKKLNTSQSQHVQESSSGSNESNGDTSDEEKQGVPRWFTRNALVLNNENEDEEEEDNEPGFMRVQQGDIAPLIMYILRGMADETHDDD